nr:HAD hydrolase family protein [Sinobaca sp. H24]
MYPWLTAAGRGFAMANALEEVKHISTEITRSNDEHGVAHVLHQLID